MEMKHGDEHLDMKQASYPKVIPGQVSSDSGGSWADGEDFFGKNGPSPALSPGTRRFHVSGDPTNGSRKPGW